MTRPAAPLVLGLALALGGGARAELIADLSSKEIAITTGFAGTELLLFGATDGRGDVVVVVRGPRRPEIVRKKERIAGIWVNGDSVQFDDVPAYYRVSATRPLGSVASDHDLGARLIGLGALKNALRSSDSAPYLNLDDFREALIRNKKAERLYDDTPSVRFVGDRLFRTAVYFPASVPTGVYHVDVHQFRSGRLVSTETTLLTVRKVGLGAQIYDFAHQRAAAYGIIAIAAAVFAGWLAGVLFRRA